MLSVCIASYNGEKFIKAQIDSILCQLSPEDEVIISDDGSTDSTISIIKKFNDNRIILIRDKPLGSPIFNLERALLRTKGDIIFLSDQDDIWLPEKVKKMVTVLDDASLVFSDAKLVNEDLEIIRASFNNGKKNHTGILKNILFNSYMGATMAFRREILLKALPFPKKIPMHDQWIGLIGDIYFRNKFIPEPLILYRRHGGNASYSGERSKNTFVRKFFFRVSIFWALIKRVVQIAVSNGKN